MSSFFGYHGNYLRVDLTSRVAASFPLDEPVLRQFIGGGGLGTWLLSQETPSGGPIDALSPQAPLLFVFSPLVGTTLTTSAKFAVVAKSPLTQRINDSLSSSHFAIAGKKTGHDAFCFVGRADEPVVAIIEPGSVRFESAEDVWGLSSEQTAARLRERLGTGFRISAIGPAGEARVRFATISNDGRHAGRGGLGAVMGSKNLKAIAVRGDRTTPVAYPEQLVEFSRELSALSFGPATAKYRELGTVSNLLTFNRLGTLPTRNFQAGEFPGALELAPETMQATHARTRASCAACTIGCEQIFTRSDGAGVRMEYENLFALGPLCGVSDPDIVLAASALCDELGLDTISTGATVAFAMECAERGLIDAPDLRFGNGSALLDAIRSIVTGERIGQLLRLGTREASRRIGQGSEEFAPHVKGLEIPGYEPRALQAMALGFAVNTRGADHNRSGAYQVDFSDKLNRLDPDLDTLVQGAIDTEDEAAVMDSLILCKFLRGVFDDRFAGMARMLELVTGWNVDADELRESARRIVTMKKSYNVSQGWTPAEDTLPRRFFDQSLADGARAGAILDEHRLLHLISAYNLARGWTESGYPHRDIPVELR